MTLHLICVKIDCRKEFGVSRNKFAAPIFHPLPFEKHDNAAPPLSDQEFPLHGQSVNDLVAVVPAVELPLLGVVFQAGVGSVPSGKVEQRGLLADHHVVDVKDALDPGAAGQAGVVNHVDGPADDKRGLCVLPWAAGVPDLLYIERGGVHLCEVDVWLAVAGGVEEPEALVVGCQVRCGFWVEAIHSSLALHGEHGDICHRAAQHVVLDHLHVRISLLLYVVQVAVINSAAGTDPIRGKHEPSAAGDARRAGEVPDRVELVDVVSRRPVKDVNLGRPRVSGPHAFGAPNSLQDLH